jgi:hypothetical protein
MLQKILILCSLMFGTNVSASEHKQSFFAYPSKKTCEALKVNNCNSKAADFCYNDHFGQSALNIKTSECIATRTFEGKVEFRPECTFSCQYIEKQ